LSGDGEFGSDGICFWRRGGDYVAVVDTGDHSVRLVSSDSIESRSLKPHVRWLQSAPILACGDSHD
jgi:hypothetical protein